MSQLKQRFLEPLQQLPVVDVRVKVGDTVQEAFGKLQGQLDKRQPVFIQAAQPSESGRYLWVQTFPSGDISFWVEDGA
jgi:hypothetical protein